MIDDALVKAITDKAAAFQVPEHLALGLADSFTSKPGEGRLGLFGLPDSVVDDEAKFLSSQEAQINAGLIVLHQAVQSSKNEFEALLNYTGNKKRALDAYVKSTQFSGEPLSAEDLAGAMRALGIKGGMQDYLQQQQPPATISTGTSAAGLQNAALSADDMQPVLADPAERKNRLIAGFGGGGMNDSVPRDLAAYIDLSVKNA